MNVLLNQQRWNFENQLNAKLSADMKTAQNYFQELSQEDSQLFIVRQAKEELKAMAVESR